LSGKNRISIGYFILFTLPVISVPKSSYPIIWIVCNSITCNSLPNYNNALVGQSRKRFTWQLLDDDSKANSKSKKASSGRTKAEVQLELWVKLEPNLEFEPRPTSQSACGQPGLRLSLRFRFQFQFHFQFRLRARLKKASK